METIIAFLGISALVVAFISLATAVKARQDVIDMRMEQFERTLEYDAKFEYLDRYSRYLSKHYVLNDKAIEHKVLSFEEFSKF
jgi:hypothetical protein